MELQKYYTNKILINIFKLR